MLSTRLQHDLALAPYSELLGETLPTCADYGELLAEMKRRTGMEDTYENDKKLREKYGRYTYGQWAIALIVTRLYMPVTYWRKPTPAEISFGNGATHYRDFEFADCLNKFGRIKRWFVSKDDGLRYYHR